ncbi:type II toxin-antitoxin system Phd/YefM family antitoxin [Phenylobacterium sp.]|uniref:type II toxin-antitoxin system Phd/YefM family antitoxin n=1 Tax=Phenylobacterium sp. TaxID=1871053 RepID=UPI002720D731|nr:type II toxin-antitoxin system prevent-host-death family antitoxin [Phenylobacterium sp.]MDO8380974.1 type II toxin-antitoxin system prevent-host-death family antitoxin [Phenylobacterium sp.]
MTTYSITDARKGLSRLIDRALAGETVTISRHGRALAELRPIAMSDHKASQASYAWLKARRLRRRGVDLTSVELLDQLYDGR